MKRKTAMSLKWGDKVIRKGVNVALQFVRYEEEIDFIFAVSEGGMEYSQSRRDFRRADKPLCPKCAEAADRALKEPPQKGSAAEVLDTALVTTGSTLASFPDAKVALDALIDWHCAVAVDPAVNGGKMLVPVDEITPAMWSAGRNEFMRIYDRVKYAMHSEIESAEIDAAPQSMMTAMLAASQEQKQ